MKRKRCFAGVLGIVICGLCLTTLLLIEAFGPGSYSSSGSGALYADGSIRFTVTRSSVLPTVAQTAFYLSLLPLCLSMISFWRKENIFASVGALACGLAPVWIMTVGSVVSATLFYCIALAVAVVAMARQFNNSHRRDRSDIL